MHDCQKFEEEVANQTCPKCPHYHVCPKGTCIIQFYKSSDSWSPWVRDLWWRWGAICDWKGVLTSERDAVPWKTIWRDSCRYQVEERPSWGWGWVKLAWVKGWLRGPLGGVRPATEIPGNCCRWVAATLETIWPRFHLCSSCSCSWRWKWKLFLWLWQQLANSKKSVTST